MADIVNTKVVFSPELLDALESFQENKNEYIDVYVSHLNNLTNLLFACVDTSCGLSNIQILDYLQYNHLLIGCLKALKAG